MKEQINLVRIHIVAPYSAMVSVLSECIPLFPSADITYSVGDLQKGLEIALEKQEDGIDLIISRGGTAKLIKKAVSIPVIDIQLSGYDLTRSLTLASKLNEKTAIVGFQNITAGAAAIIKLLHLPINVYTIHSANEVTSLLLKLKQAGYSHILGDVITINTSHEVGLKGMLLQSGKESVARAIEEAIYLIQTLSRQTIINHVMKSLLIEEHRNIIMFDEDETLLYKHFQDFRDPLEESEWSLLHTSLAINESIKEFYTKEQGRLQVRGMLLDKRYKVYVLSRLHPVLNLKGVTEKTIMKKEPVAMSSVPSANRFRLLQHLFKKNEAVVISGERGTGKTFLTRQLHILENREEPYVEIDADVFLLQDLEHLLTKKPRTIVLNQFSIDEHQELLSACLQKRKANSFRLIMHTSARWDEDQLEAWELKHVHMPVLADRKEDMGDLATFFLADFHQIYGTRPVGISEEAIAYLENVSYKHHIRTLREVIKNATMDEKEYLLSKEVIKSVVETTEQKQTFPINGTLKEMEKAIIAQVLQEENQNQTQAAKRLGINRATLWRKLKD